jgi:hypothetical protein
MPFQSLWKQVSGEMYSFLDLDSTAGRLLVATIINIARCQQRVAIISFFDLRRSHQLVCHLPQLSQPHFLGWYHGLMDKDVVELMKLHEELANIRHGQKINSGQRQA